MQPVLQEESRIITFERDGGVTNVRFASVGCPSPIATMPMTFKNLIVTVTTLLAALSAVGARAETVMLNPDQVKALASHRYEYSFSGRVSTLFYTFYRDGTWSVETALGSSASGTWTQAGSLICRKETDIDGTWEGLNSKNLCFGFSTGGTNIYVGNGDNLVEVSDPAVIGEIIAMQETAPAPETLASSLAKTPSTQGSPIKPARIVEDSTMWRSIEDSREIADFQLYLKRFPAGVFVPLAERRLRQLAAYEAQASVSRESRDSESGKAIFGAYHAVVIGINAYKNLSKLKTAIADGRAVAETLRDQYGFSVRLLENPTRGDILDTFDGMRDSLTESDNLLIYYAGHGWLDPQSGRGYWLPVDARTDRRSKWVSNADLTDALHALFAKHVMVVADSCYSGTLTRSIKVPDRGPNYLRRIAATRARVVLSSGGLEPVEDGGGGKHSVFAAQFLAALRANTGVLDGTQLFDRVRRNVMLRADQTPQYSDIRKAGHEGGDFLFVSR